MNKNILNEKYVELLLKRCLNFKLSNSLFISYDKLNKEFINLVIKKASEMGINDIYEEEIDSFYKHDLLQNIDIKEIKDSPYFSSKSWDIYAEKNASFLFIETEIPGLMDDIDPDKLAIAAYTRRSTKPIYNEKRDKGIIPWCIAAYPNEYWAKDLFPNESNAYQKLFDKICSICMIDTDNPIDSWNKELENSKERALKLNNLKISKLHYYNSKGTDLYLELPDKAIWCSAAEGDKLVNMPSYEIFTSPDYRKTNGIVYSALPLIYNGAIIKDFSIEFKDGKAVSCHAVEGEKVLTGIINSDSNSCYLGECALVNNDSPISNTGLVFKTTLFDENASCHLALGTGFNECYLNGINMSNEELLANGVNYSKNHVDFMIGTTDLNIEAETIEGEKLIFKNGNFNI